MLAALRTAFVRHRKPLAVTGSVGLHLVLIWMFLLEPSSGALADLDKRALGALTQEGVNVDLVPPAPEPAPPMPAAPPKPPQTQALDTFAAMSKPATATTSAPLSSPSPAKSLSEVFGKDVFAPSPASQPRAETQHPSNQESHVKLANQADRPTPNDLWKAIEPCWRRVVTRDTETVTLSVSFSPLGNLAKPPVIMRPTGAQLDDRRLKSEAKAINALAQCGPYLMAFGQSDVSVQFPAGG
jgi:hypothetical protein